MKKIIFLSALLFTSAVMSSETTSFRKSSLSAEDAALLTKYVQAKHARSAQVKRAVKDDSTDFSVKPHKAHKQKYSLNEISQLEERERDESDFWGDSDSDASDLRETVETLVQVIGSLERAIDTPAAVRPAAIK